MAINTIRANQIQVELEALTEAEREILAEAERGAEIEDSSGDSSSSEAPPLPQPVPINLNLPLPVQADPSYHEARSRTRRAAATLARYAQSSVSPHDLPSLSQRDESRVYGAAPLFNPATYSVGTEELRGEVQDRSPSLTLQNSTFSTSKTYNSLIEEYNQLRSLGHFDRTPLKSFELGLSENEFDRAKFHGFHIYEYPFASVPKAIVKIQSASSPLDGEAKPVEGPAQLPLFPDP